MTELVMENDVEKKNLENIRRIIDLTVYEEVTARSQATQDEAKKGWWIANKERFIK
jgi:hypothetical protein